MSRFLIFAPDYRPADNERWVRTVKQKAEVLDADILFFDNKEYSENAKLICLKNTKISRYISSIKKINELLRNYDLVIFEANSHFLYIKYLYILMGLGIVYAKKIVAFAYCAKKPFQKQDFFLKIFVGSLIKSLAAFVVYDSADYALIKAINSKIENLYTMSPSVDILTTSNTGFKSETAIFNILFASAPMVGESAEEALRDKGVDRLLEAVAKLNRNHKIQLTLLWRGVYKKELMTLINKLGISQSVDVLDRKVNIYEYFEKSQLLVFPAISYNSSPHYPFSVIESLVAGVPVIVSKKFAIADYVEKNSCGVVIGDEDDLAEAILKLLKGDCELSSDFALRARSTFDIRVNLNNLINEVLNG